MHIFSDISRIHEMLINLRRQSTSPVFTVLKRTVSREQTTGKSLIVLAHNVIDCFDT